MSTKKIVQSIAAGVGAFLVVALACNGAGLNAHGFVLLPLAAGAGAAYLAGKK